MILAHIGRNLYFARNSMWQRIGFENLYKARIIDVGKSSVNFGVSKDSVNFIFYGPSNQRRDVNMPMQEFLASFTPLGQIAEEEQSQFVNAGPIILGVTPLPPPRLHYVAPNSR
jgi:hypothetical protein